MQIITEIYITELNTTKLNSCILYIICFPWIDIFQKLNVFTPCPNNIINIEATWNEKCTQKDSLFAYIYNRLTKSESAIRNHDELHVPWWGPLKILHKNNTITKNTKKFHSLWIFQENHAYLLNKDINK